MTEKSGHRVNLAGIIPALVTPFSDDGGQIRWDVLTELAQDLVAGGASALLSCGGTAEFEHLSHAERRQLTETVVHAVEGSVPIVAHTGAMTTMETLELSRHAEQAGASCLMVFTPYVRSPSWGEIHRHYEAVAESRVVADHGLPSNERTIDDRPASGASPDRRC